MSVDAVAAIARTLLYEGYLLYPYRPSAIKNRQRFNFGVLYPEPYARASSEASALEAQFPVCGTGESQLAISVRFLQLSEAAADGSSWQVGIERDLALEPTPLDDLARAPTVQAFAFRPVDGRGLATPPAPTGADPISGLVEVHVERVAPDAGILRVRVANAGSLDGTAARDSALVRALVSAHVVARVDGGEFVSLLDPPPDRRDLSARCANTGVFPVLVGEPGRRDCMVASSIILYDYPQIAPESAGDLFDGTEIDEILALRILTLTEDEKREVRHADDRARAILDRTEGLAPEHWARLHGAVRGLRRATGDAP
jgi:hypothetical protein